MKKRFTSALALTLRLRTVINRYADTATEVRQ